MSGIRREEDGSPHSHQTHQVVPDQVAFRGGETGAGMGRGRLNVIRGKKRRGQIDVRKLKRKGKQKEIRENQEEEALLCN